MSNIENIQTRLDDNEFAAWVFVDFFVDYLQKKASDMVDHEVLIQKLDDYGVKGITEDWFCSYLANRKLFVSVNNHNSTIQTILTGVPQGSVLGPLLLFFSLFTSMTFTTA